MALHDIALLGQAAAGASTGVHCDALLHLHKTPGTQTCKSPAFQVLAALMPAACQRAQQPGLTTVQAVRRGMALLGNEDMRKKRTWALSSLWQSPFCSIAAVTRTATIEGWALCILFCIYQEVNVPLQLAAASFSRKKW